MRLLLLVKNKLGFVDGTCSKSQYKGELADQWEGCNAVVLSWISSTVAPGLMTTIVYASNAKRVWEDFKERFAKSDLTRVYQLWTEVATLRQSTDSVTDYYTKMKNPWDEYDMTVPAPACGCPESKPYVEHFCQQRLLMFLMGLNKSFSHVRSDILLKTNVPSVNQAYAIVTQEESQRLLGVVDDVHKEPLTMMAGRGYGFKGKKVIRVGGTGCEVCGFKNHLTEDYYRVVGYPVDFKSKRRNNAAGSYQNNTADGQVQDFGLSEEEHNQLSNLNLNHSVGPNSGATHHITACKSLLEDLKCLEEYASSIVQLPTGNKAQITNTGISVILGNLTVKDVLHALYSGKVIGIGRQSNRLYLLRSEIKATVGAAIRDTSLTELCTQFEVKVKVLRSDNGTKFFNSKYGELFSTLIIVHQSSCAYTPQRNGIMERKHRHILDTARALRTQANIPIKFWGHCLPRLDKFASRAKKAVFMGYSDTQKGYSLLELESKTFLVSREVTFTKHVFPFKTNSGESEDIFVPADPLGSVSCVVHADLREPPPSIDHTIQPVQVIEPAEQLPPDEPIEPQTQEGLENSTILESTTNTVADIDQVEPVTDDVVAVITAENPISPSRTSKAPVWHRDYVLAAYQVYVAAILVALEPSNFKDASRHEHWVEAMQAEVDALEQN
ncbi:uncharacterized protein LOC132047432 [Lycium ferocissimum]|uniref:uncharacterized protein LOC132047432 n=1 Tax=Lycium ferocissimum TaxID=112874 RepID=UPI0028150C90|nr:uncharacterized protein LOC132047432 [Lycium ferocissimum]